MPTEHGLIGEETQGQAWDRQRWLREEVAALSAAFAAAEGSERQRAATVGVPRATMRGWLQDAERDSGVVAVFFRTPEGVALLHRIVLAAFITITLLGAGGLRAVQTFLRLSQLSQYVASSYGALHAFSKLVEQALLEFEAHERVRLAHQMAAKLISVCLDETFHPEICLVGMEPVSGFILLERYSEKRDSASWDLGMTDALEDLKVEVVQATSDEAKAIIHYVEYSLGAEHSPDVFHVQHELAKGTSAALAAQVRAAEAKVQVASSRVADCEDALCDHVDNPRPGRPPDYLARLEQAQEEQHAAGEKLSDAMLHKTAMRDVIRGISQDYHPFELDTGAPRTGATVQRQLEGRFAKAQQIVEAAGLPERCRRAVTKASAVVHAMVDTVDFVHRSTAAQVATLPIPLEARQLLLALLIPALYLQRVAKRAPCAALRQRINAVASDLRARFEQAVTWTTLSDANRTSALAVANQCADLFQRSSSCVEGRNGRLSLHHHGIHRLRPNKLRSLTIIHNYFLQRRDGSTAAERFFGTAPNDLFDWLVRHVHAAARPSTSRTPGGCPYDA